jgi:putative PIN family toxin of toxin-antitoxin system
MSARAWQGSTCATLRVSGAVSRGARIDKCRGIVYDTTMGLPPIVIDTNVFVSALRSQYCASYKLLMLLDSDKFEVNLSVPLALEYEDAGKRLIDKKGALKTSDVDDILDYICSVARQRMVYYLWRPFLSDPKDDMVLELAVSAGSNVIVTYNKDDFRGVEQFGIRALTALEFLREIGELE